jgi:hypothetical protein
VDSASDDEMRELAAAGQQRQLDDMDGRLRSLSGTVAEMAAKILARPTPNQVWNWKEFNEQERAAGLADLEAWMRTTLIRYPQVVHLLRPCWKSHDYALDALTAAYGTWLLAHHGKANFEQLAYWLDRWLVSLQRQLQESLGGCTPKRHEPDEIELDLLG